VRRKKKEGLEKTSTLTKEVVKGWEGFSGELATGRSKSGRILRKERLKGWGEKKSTKGYA